MRALIVFVTLIVLAVVAGAIVVGMKTFEGTVVEKPYETGLAWNAVEKNKASLGWRLDVRTQRFRTGGNHVVLLLADKERNPLSGAEVSITISRPSTNLYDRDYRALGRGGGVYESDVQLPLFGYWDMKVRVLNEGKDVVFHESIYAEKN